MTVQTKKSKFAPIDLLVEDLVTDMKFNPLKSKYLDQWTVSQQREAAGLLPHFFLSAWYDIEDDLIDNDTAAVISVEELFTKLKTGVEESYRIYNDTSTITVLQTAYDRNSETIVLYIARHERW